MKGEIDAHKETVNLAFSPSASQACVCVTLGERSRMEGRRERPVSWVRLQWKLGQTHTLGTYCVLRTLSFPLLHNARRQLLSSGHQLHSRPGGNGAWPRSHSWWVQSWLWNSDLCLGKPVTPHVVLTASPSSPCPPHGASRRI